MPTDGMQSPKWTLHPGDWVVVQEIGDADYRVLFRTPSDLELQHHLQYVNLSTPVMVFQVKGRLP